MGLDITFVRKRTTRCPNCGHTEMGETVREISSSGRGWYPILENLGYYVPYEKRTEENDWYGKDMTLTREQMLVVHEFLTKHADEFYDGDDIDGMIALAFLDGDEIVVNADW